jgi:LPS sulfotransferase NodH
VLATDFRLSSIGHSVEVFEKATDDVTLGKRLSKVQAIAFDSVADASRPSDDILFSLRLFFFDAATDWSQMIPRRWRLALQLERLRPRSSGQSTGPRKFVLFAKQRSGSTWVIDLLNSHPAVVGYSELFLDDMWGKPPVGGNRGIDSWNSFLARFVTRTGSEPDRAARKVLYREYLDHQVFSADTVPGAEAAQAIGLKLMYNQAVSDIAIPRYLQNRAVSCVHLIRRNHLDAILSAEAVKIRGLAHAEHDTDVSKVAIELEPESIALRIERRSRDIEAASELINFLRLPAVELFYEDLIDNVAAIKSVLEFLGVDPDAADLTSRLRKLNSTGHPNLIANYDDVAKALRGTRFCDLLRE